MTAAIHHWRKGNISTIVTVLGDLAQSDSSHTPLAEGNISTIVTVLGDLAQSDSSHTPLAEGKHIYHCHSVRPSKVQPFRENQKQIKSIIVHVT